MKKDFNWFKERLDDIEMNSPSLWSHTSIWMLDRVNELLDQLDEPEVLSQEWIDCNKEPFHHFETNKVDYYVSTDFLQNILVPKPELPVIPNYVAKWISEHHEKFDLYPALRRLEEGSTRDYDAYKWYRKNTRKFVNAYLTGEYEVEEEQKYTVELPSAIEHDDMWPKVALSKLPNGELQVRKTKRGTGLKLHDKYLLTENEIKDYDERYWPFAVKVEELEE